MRLGSKFYFAVGLISNALYTLAGFSIQLVVLTFFLLVTLLNLKKIKWQKKIDVLSFIMLVMALISLTFGYNYLHYFLGWTALIMIYHTNISFKWNGLGYITPIFLLVIIFLKYTSGSLLIFSEPSHLVLFLTPILVNQIKEKSVDSTLNLVFFFILLTSMSSAIGLLLLVYLTWLRFGTKAIYSFLAIFILAGTTFLDEYYLSRLTLDSETENISTLVILQAYEIVYNVISSFSLFGYHPSNMINLMQGYFSLRLQSLYGATKHLEDGGIALAHGLVYYGYFYLVYTTIILKRALRKRKDYLPFIIGGSLELFVRGMGLFTLNLMLLCLKEE